MIRLMAGVACWGTRRQVARVRRRMAQVPGELLVDVAAQFTYALLASALLSLLVLEYSR